jgi:RNA polymerase sigma-70 factor (ECF subfamily)
MEATTPAAPTETFEDAVLAHRALLHRVALRMTGSHAEADDLVQETLLKAFRHFARLRPDSQVRPWLLRIMHNAFISRWRRAKREREVLEPAARELDASWVLPRGVGGAPDESARHGLGDEVVAALGELPDAYRTCVVLVDLEEKSYREAADALGRPLGTVMSRLFRGRRLLMGKLDGYARREGYVRTAA